MRYSSISASLSATATIIGSILPTISYSPSVSISLNASVSKSVIEYNSPLVSISRTALVSKSVILTTSPTTSQFVIATTAIPTSSTISASYTPASSNTNDTSTSTYSSTIVPIIQYEKINISFSGIWVNDAYYQIDSILLAFAKSNVATLINMTWINNTYTIHVLTTHKNFTQQFTLSQEYFSLINLLNPILSNNNQNISAQSPQQNSYLGLNIGITFAIMIFGGFVVGLFFIYRTPKTLPKNTLHLATVKVDNPLLAQNNEDTEKPVTKTLDTIRKNDTSIMVENIMHKKLDTPSVIPIEDSMENRRKSLVVFNPIQVSAHSGIDEYNMYSTKYVIPKNTHTTAKSPSKTQLRIDFNPLQTRRSQLIPTPNIDNLPSILKRLPPAVSVRLIRSSTVPINPFIDKKKL